MKMPLGFLAATVIEASPPRHCCSDEPRANAPRSAPQGKTKRGRVTEWMAKQFIPQVPTRATVGDRLVTPSGATIGTVENLIVDVRTDEVYVVVPSGELAEEDYVALPSALITTGPVGGVYTIDLDEEMISAARPQSTLVLTR